MSRAIVYMYVAQKRIFIERSPRKDCKYVDFYTSHDTLYKAAKSPNVEGWSSQIERIAIAVARDYAESGGSQRDLKLVYHRAKKRNQKDKNQLDMFGGLYE